ncbi:hypothetical protein niasHT_017195 [Heterodera trifolii]|uniref:FH2 domain-containing protein n=1 Tax=Heterodera trifolii TaxID=157864 RepID=A0ABD2LD48_9BILA
MVAQCADSTASSSPMENSASLDIIIDDDHNHHHHHQQQQPFVFGPNLMQMVSNLLLKAFDSGQFAVVEQLLCWPDAIDWSHTLCLVLNELRTTRHCMAAVALVRAVAQLLRMAPAAAAAAADHHHTTPSSNSSREQQQLLRNQIKVLRFDELMRSLRERFVSAAASDDPSIEHHYLLLEEAIEDCLIHMTKTTADQQQRHGRDETEATEAVTRNSRTDADSGTFSGDEEEMKQQQMPLSDRDKKVELEEGGQQHHMANDEQQQHQQQQHINEVIRLVHTLPAQEVPLLAKFLRTNRRSLGPLVSLINSSKHHQHQQQQRHHLDDNNCQPSISQFEKRPAPPPPPPPPPASQMLLSTIAAATSSPQRCPLPGAATTAFPPAAPPPPPPPPAPSSLVRPPPAPPLASPAAASVCRELNTNGSSSGQQLPAAEIPSALRPKALPDQCRRLRHLQWTKLPTNAVAAAATTTTATAAAAPNCANVWQTMEAVDREMRDRLDFAVLDAFFGCSSNTPQNISSSSDISHHRSSPSWSTARRRSSMMMNGGGTCGDSVVSLLDAKRSLSVNVFLKMCRDSGQLLIDLAEGKADKIGADRLRTIAHLLPSADEQKLLRDFSGDKQVLGAAEQFLLALIERIPAHRLRVEAMLFQLDLQAMLDTNRPSDVGTLGLKVWLKGCQELLCSSTLRKVLYALLHLGNYLNHGAGAGNAVGFRLSSLWKVEDVKTIGGTTRGRTLLHFVAQQVDNCAQELAAELQSVREAAKSSLEAISDDVRSLSERMHCLEEGIARTKFAAAAPNSAGGDNFLDDFLHFLEKSRHIIASAERQLAELGTLRRQVAIFLCEQERTFSLEECFKVIAWFVTRFEKAVEDNRRFMERNLQQQQQQQQLEMGNNQFRKPSPDNLDGMALKSVIKKRDRLSFALVDERERQQTPSSCPPSSPGKVRRRRTAHSVTPLLDARLFLNGLDEGVVERSANTVDMKKDGIIIEQSLEAVVDQALMRKEIVSARETKCTKIDEEKKGQQEEEKHVEMVAQQMANSTPQQDKLMLAPQIMPVDEAKFSARQQHPEQQNVPTKEENLLQDEAVPPSPALVTMSTKAKKHLLTDRNSTAETQQQQQQRQRVKTNAPRTHGQTVPERVGGQQQQQQFGTNNNRTAATPTINVKPNASRMLPSAAVGVLRTAQKRANNLAPAPKCTATITTDPSSAPKCAPAVCRIRIVAKPNSNNNGHGITTTIEADQHQQKRAQHQQQMCSLSSAVPDRPLKPSQVKACQPKVQKPAAAHDGVGTLGQKAIVTASAGPLKMGKNSTGSKRSATTTTTAATSTSVGSCQMMMMISRGQTAQCQEKQQQQKDCKATAPAQQTQPQQQQQQHLRATKPTLTRRLSTSSRPTLVHSTGRSCTTTAGSREKEKPKWI